MNGKDRLCAHRLTVPAFSFQVEVPPRLLRRIATLTRGWTQEQLRKPKKAEFVSWTVICQLGPQKYQELAMAHATRSSSAGAQIPLSITLVDLKKTVMDAVNGTIPVGDKTIGEYDGKISAEAIDFVENYEEITTSRGWDDDRRYKSFNQYLSNSAKNWYKLFVKKTTTPPADWAALKQAFVDYHVPTDRTVALREQMIKRKQSKNEDVICYITDKRLLCIEYNSTMGFDEMRRHIIEGMISEIRTTILHKDNPAMVSLQRNAKNIEKG